MERQSSALAVGGQDEKRARLTSCSNPLVEAGDLTEFLSLRVTLMLSILAHHDQVGRRIGSARRPTRLATRGSGRRRPACHFDVDQGLPDLMIVVGEVEGVEVVADGPREKDTLLRNDRQARSES